MVPGQYLNMNGNILFSHVKYKLSNIAICYSAFDVITKAIVLQ